MKLKSILFSIFLSSPILLLAQTQPVAPKEEYTIKNKQMEKRLSSISVPFEIMLTDVEKQINNNIKDLIYEDNSMEDNNNDNLMCKVYKRENIKVSTLNSDFVFTVPLKVWVRIGYKVMGVNLPAQELNFEMNVKFGTTFSIANNWEANTKSYLIGYDWVKKPTLRFAGIDISVATMVEKSLNSKQDKILKAIDESVKKNLTIKKYVIQAWNTAMQPVLLSEKYRTWLKVTPTELVMTPIVTTTDRAKATIGINAITETITGVKPNIKTVSEIPDLRKVQTVTDKFEVAIISEIPYLEASSIAADTLVGQVFDFKDGKYKVTVTGLEMYGQKEQLVIKAGLIGNVKGTIYYKGLPTYNPENKSIYLENFDYDLETKNILIKTANWIFQGKLAKKMKEALVFPLDNQLTEMRTQMAKTLSNNQVTKGVLLNGEIIELRPEKVYLSENALYSVTIARGKVNLKIDGLE